MGKNNTYAMFGRPGYEEIKQALDQKAPKNPKFMM
jgi:hypothetical protein